MLHSVDTPRQTGALSSRWTVERLLLAGPHSHYSPNHCLQLGDTCLRVSCDAVPTAPAYGGSHAGVPVLTAVLAALGSAAGFSVSTALQHQSAGAAPPGRRGAVSLLLHLVRRPGWLLGTLIGLVAFGLHAVAVHAGALAVVQPIATSGMVLAVLGRPALDRTLPSRREAGWAGVTAGGLTLFVISSHPQLRGADNQSRSGLILVGTGVVVAAALSYAARRQRGANSRGLLLGSSAGVLFGMVAGVLKLSVNTGLGGGVLALVTSWPLWALIALGICGVVLNQHAYQGSPLSVTMPVLNVVDVLVAVGFGYAVFGEVPAHGPAALAAETVGLVLMAVGVRQLTREPGSSLVGGGASTASARSEDLS